MPVSGFIFGGGENLDSPASSLKPGELLFSKNYEARVQGGYRRIDGYERYDGQAMASEASYWVMNFDAGTTLINVGDLIDNSFAATAEVLLVVVESGDWATNDAAGYLIVYKLTGSWLDDEPIEISAAPRATVNGTVLERGATSDAQDDIWQQAAIEAYRADIGAPDAASAQFANHGMFMLDGDLFAVVPDTGVGTNAVIMKATPTGWVEQSLGSYIDFTVGTDQLAVGEVLTGASGNGTVLSYVVTSGDWSSNDAAGRIYLGNITGTFGAEVLNGDIAATLTCSGAALATEIAMTDGDVRGIEHNFYGSTSSKAAYVVTGSTRAFVYTADGLGYIHTGLPEAQDRPSLLVVHYGHLFLVTSSSLMHSAPGDGTNFTDTTLAGEIAVGDTITSVLSQSQVLTIGSRNRIDLLYGTDVANWELRPFGTVGAGMMENTAQLISQPYYLDAGGMKTLASTETTAGFASGDLSQRIRPLIEAKMREVPNPVKATCVVRTKDQYRIFFHDNMALYVTISPQGAQFTRVYFDGTLPFDRVCVGEDANGNEAVYVARSGGDHVFKLDSGTSFDGVAIASYARLAFNNIGSAQQHKQFQKIVMELRAGNAVNLQFNAEYDYADPSSPSSPAQSFSAEGGQGAIWGTTGEWGDFIWGGKYTPEAEGYFSGVGRNLSLGILSESIYDEPHTLEAGYIYYQPRRSAL